MPSDRQLLQESIRTYCAQNHLAAQVKCYASGEELLADFSPKVFDLLFIDIYLSGMDGMHLAEQIHSLDSACLLVFTTASVEHAVASYRVRAFDYLLKPYTPAQFNEVFRLCDTAVRSQAHYIEVKVGRECRRVLLSDILYTDYYNHYIQIHTRDNIIRTYLSFGEFSKMLLRYPQFLCCYRNCIINMDEVSAIQERDFVLSNGDRVPISRNQRIQMRQRYADYIFTKLEESHG